ncbi:cysteine desulfurase family protein [Microbacterium sp. PAMC22086]|uniref:cysteine desulfurase family protein n=1 Tax=Microbacterium sp. PAMC22086 TaxID=2861281 RepID=UPI001C624EA8|nr:cysteine desulfurase family protein [Microbacterium sp. PAMC22086]QYG10473.1 cysteine desulfurase [Microbacterium sp. PAMC22086]
MLYLDHAATSPVRPEVLEAMGPYLSGVYGNPSSHHTAGEAAAGALDDARARVARILGRRTGDVVFTAGGTEANNLAVKGIVLAALEAGRRHLVISPIEHESILESAEYLRRFHAVEVTLLPVDARGRIAPDDLTAAIRDDTALVSIGHANNEIGTIQDATALASVTRAARVPLHLDAVQSAGWLGLRDLGADAVSIAGHKLGTPKGIGALAVRGRVPIEPLLHGGGQERGRRSGTENVAGAVALATALEIAEHEREVVAARVGAATRHFIALVLDSIPEAVLTGDAPHRLPGTASFTFAGTSGESVLLELERRGVISSSGSACAAGSDEPSHVLLACAVAPEVAQTAVRFTFGRVPLPEDAPVRLAALVTESVRAARG